MRVSYIRSPGGSLQPSSQIQNLVATTVSFSQINLSWTAVTGASYNIQRNGAFYLNVPSASYADTGLTPATLYTYTVSSLVGGVEGTLSMPAQATTNAASTLAITSTSPLPGGVSGSAYSTALAASGGASPYTWSLVSGTLANLTLSSAGVISGTPTAQTDSLVIQVMDSLSSAVSKTFSLTISAAATVPGAPTGVSASAGNASATITFTAPSNGGSPITGYVVTSSPGALTGSGSSSPIQVNGLTNGTAYTFTVKATNAVGTGPASAASNSVTPIVSTALVLYANGVRSSQFPAGSPNDLSFACTLTQADTTHVTAGHTSSLKVATNSAFGGGWQPGSLWTTLPPNGFDCSPYTYLQFDMYTPNTTNMYVGSHYSRSTGNDIGASAGCDQTNQNETTWGALTANAFTTITVPLTKLAMIGSKNFYKFAIGTSGSNQTFWLDNVKFLAGTWTWVADGLGTPVNGWSDASTGVADYTWLPQTLKPGTSGLFSLNNPPLSASLFTGTFSSGSPNFTVNSLTSGTIKIGDTFCWQGNLGGSPFGTVVSGSGSSWAISTNFTTSLSATPCTTSPSQNIMTGIKLTATAVNQMLKLTHASFALGSYTYLTFGAIPTKSGYGYQVQFYNTSGVAVGTAVTALPYTTHNVGVSTSDYTVYNIPLSAFGSLPANVGGFSIKETSANATNVTYFSGVGFYS